MVGVAYSSGTDSANMTLQLERSMRGVPTVIIDPAKVGLTFNGVYVYTTNISWANDASMFNPIIKGRLTLESGTFPGIGYPCVPYSDDDIYVSADI